MHSWVILWYFRIRARVRADALGQSQPNLHILRTYSFPLLPCSQLSVYCRLAGAESAKPSHRQAELEWTHKLVVLRVDDDLGGLTTDSGDRRGVDVVGGVGVKELDQA